MDTNRAIGDTETAENPAQCEWGQDVSEPVLGPFGWRHPGHEGFRYEQCKNPWTHTIVDRNNYLMHVCLQCKAEAEEIGWVESRETAKT